MTQDRAQRFGIRSRVLWRPAGQDEWFEGIIINVSRSGVLFEADRNSTVDTKVDMIVCWSSDAFGYSEAADLNCVGRIVRVESEIASPAQCKLAATIDFYTFMRQSSGT